MAELVLTTVGAQLGSKLAPAGFAALGQALGSAAGSFAGARIDRALFGGRRAAGPRLTELHVQGSSEGSSIPLVFGRMRIAGQVIWAARFREREGESGGGKGGPSAPEGVRYTCSFAVGLCEGRVARIDRIWANGAPLDTTGVTWRLHEGSETQSVDPVIEAVEGLDAPAYRGLAYVVFEDFPLDDFGSSLPQLSFEVVRAREEAGPTLETLARGVCLIPGAGEFVYATEVVRRRLGPGLDALENSHAQSERANLLVSLDQLQADLPNCTSVLLVSGWFGDDLRCGRCTIRPGVEIAEKDTAPEVWRAGGVDRGGARLISQIEGGPAYGGSPSDASLVAAIEELKARGFRVGLYPFLFMDVPAGSGLPDPYGGAEQAAYPWRGRITLDVAPGLAGTADGTPAATSDVAAFFGTASAGDFDVSGGAVDYDGPNEWRFRRFVLHHAAIAAAAGGVDAFVIGSELRGLTSLRGAGESYPAVSQLQALAAEVRALLPAAKITYAADWSEYFGHQPQDGTGDVRFHLDPLWADANIDMVGVDWYPPLTDWRDGAAHADASDARDAWDFGYLQSRIEGGENYAWFYASEADRAAQVRTPITDGAHGEPWVYRAKDLRSWWANAHHERVGGVRSAAPTAWVPKSKPIWLTELGCPAVDKGANAPNLFFDPKSAESALPPFSDGERDELIQRRTIEAYLDYWRTDGPNAETSPVYGGPMLDPADIHLWAWDARPHPQFPVREDVWADANAWGRGHWLNGRAGAGDLAAVVQEICARAGALGVDVSGLNGAVAGYVVDSPASARDALEPLLLAHDVEVRESAGALRFSHGSALAQALDTSLLMSEPEHERADPADAPGEARVLYIDAARDYRAAVLAARAPDVETAASVTIEIGTSLSEAQARAIAERELARAGVQRLLASLSPLALAPEPGDRLLVEGALYRVSEIEDGAQRALTLVRETAPPGRIRAAEPPASAPAPLASRPEALLISAPPLPGEEQDGRPLAAAFAQPWTPVRVRGGEASNALSDRGRLERPAIMGRLAWDLYPGPLDRFDDGNVVEVFGPGPSAVTTGDLLNGANRFAVVRPDGRAEVLQAADVALVSPGRYRLSKFLRGLFGTGVNMGAPHPAGSAIVALDGRLARVSLAPEEVGAAMVWAFAAQEAETQIAFTPAAEHARPFAPAHLRLARTPDGDVEARWIRQTRLGGDGWSVAEPPLGEERQAYQVQVWAGGTLLREVETASPSHLYTAAQQSADGAAGLLIVRVAQRSTTYGAGAHAESSIML